MKTPIQNLFIMLALLAGIHQAAAQGTTAFTYQGQLRDGGTNANGTYTMTFKLYDAVSAGGQVGSTVTTSPMLANGLFSVNLDFGTGAFNGNARWLDITAQSGTNAPETLTPRVQVLPAPYALYSSSAGSAGSLGNGTWNASVGNYQTYSNIFGIFANNSLVLGLSTNGALINGPLLVSGDLAVTGGGSGLIPQMQVCNTSRTFVVPDNVTRIMVEVWGGGGGGGGGGGAGNGGVNNYGGNGGGGGGGGYGKEILFVTPGSNMVVTVGLGGTGGQGGYGYGSGTNGASGGTGGDGGTTSLGSVNATGGAGGKGGSGGPGSSGGGSYGDGGDPGTSTADIAINGFRGWPGIMFTGPGGAGANGGAGGTSGSSWNGQTPGGGGSGSGGGIGGNINAPNASKGAKGRVIVWW